MHCILSTGMFFQFRTARKTKTNTHLVIKDVDVDVNEHDRLSMFTLKTQNNNVKEQRFYCYSMFVRLTAPYYPFGIFNIFLRHCHFPKTKLINTILKDTCKNTNQINTILKDTCKDTNQINYIRHHDKMSELISQELNVN